MAAVGFQKVLKLVLAMREGPLNNGHSYHASKQLGL